MGEQIGDPFGIFYVCLAPGDRFEVMRVDDQDLKVSLQQVINRFPIHPVASSAIWVQPCSFNQSRISNRLPVIVR